MEKKNVMLRISRYLYGGIFDDKGNILIVIDDQGINLPGGIITNEDYIRHGKDLASGFLSEKIEKDTGMTSFLKKGQETSLETSIMMLPATYILYSVEDMTEYSAIIIGETASGNLVDPNAWFIDIEGVLFLMEEGFIKEKQGILILRMMASRDCPNKDYRKTAGKELRRYTTLDA
jgi:hypothetical protein